MRRIINATYMSLDGVVQHPELWTFDYRSDDAAQAANEQLFTADALVMGRYTYDYGSVTRLLIDHGLLDELRIWLHPLLVGKAKASDQIGAVGAQARFQLKDVRRFDSGLLILSYQYQRPENE